jgi:chromate transport protein ChrA
MIYLGLYGIRASGVALIVHVTVKYAEKHINNRTHVGMAVGSTLVLLQYPQPSTLLTLTALGAVYMLMLEYDVESKDLSPSHARD